MDLISIIRNLLHDRKLGVGEKIARKRKILDFIENNSTKSDFLHWLLNNTKSAAFSEDDSWLTIKQGVEKNPKISYSLLRDYSITLRKGKITQEMLGRVIEETEEAEQVARKLTFLGSFKKFSVAVGGALLFLGIAKIILAITIILAPSGLFPSLSSHLIIGLAAFGGAAGIIDLLGGIFLIAM